MANADNMRNSLRKRWEERSRQAMNRVQAETRREAPQITGALRTSTVWEQATPPAADVLAYIIESRAPYASFVDAGTRPHKIYPRNASVLRFVAGGRVRFATMVNHPGNKARNFFGSGKAPNWVMAQRWRKALQAVR